MKEICEKIKYNIDGEDQKSRITQVLYCNVFKCRGK